MVIILYIYSWLGGWNMNLIFPNQIGDDDPIWRTHIFQRCRSTTNQIEIYWKPSHFLHVYPFLGCVSLTIPHYTIPTWPKGIVSKGQPAYFGIILIGGVFACPMWLHVKFNFWQIKPSVTRCQPSSYCLGADETHWETIQSLNLEANVVRFVFLDDGVTV